MNPCQFFKCLADETRLKSLLIIQQLGEACVCDLIDALALDQPKVSRHLAELRRCGVVQDERRGKWVYYTLHPDLEQWQIEVITGCGQSNPDYIGAALKQLATTATMTSHCT